MELTFISSPPSEVSEEEALDAYSLAVTTVAERLSPSVGNLRVSRRVRGGRILGPARAFEWLASGRKLTAAEAHAWGLVSEVVETDALAARAAEVGAHLAALPTRGIGMTKRLIDHALTATLEQQLEREAELQTAATQTEDFKEGVGAFLEKRPPAFRGN